MMTHVNRPIRTSTTARQTPLLRPQFCYGIYHFLPFYESYPDRTVIREIDFFRQAVRRNGWDSQETCQVCTEEHLEYANYLHNAFLYWYNSPLYNSGPLQAAQMMLSV
ncbi:uncharacterized protein BT62DRAFT_547310 [Guyanagaster necrorhizus]|uniref:Uncharacterized protein n=1 Tax=Guyanagaster necrorhizus TaxID=856835 RepID=A0A9P7VJV3_9AGAR|nr:uncharacterized protein BT62DRAFT_547310 [Guyanagaster necrorhizus MCA 3950]KAG7441269.1 hypothetical protein BT62DRAFT_547310 [Guyanagaster necrorhizus MCA 3950]